MRYVALVAILTSLTVCFGLEMIALQTLREKQKIIDAKRRELEPLQPMWAEVQSYQTKKDALQKRIDMINELKLAQQGPAGALKILAAMDLSNADSIAIDAHTITINSHAEV